ncbi:VirB4 family type IV secretion/conjugal transfer ATPase [uncultured Azohydromonas sp.]|jgi:Type IV secretory pathway, VirB4 components|uniref:VirB4 family type IV secretion/conjugal transfer ATPase n=1 Tax=uncultured Azohydromonas sp. TaxID=487342 RepID=UPI002601BA0D|nr:VirB4 family type IV secretion/conjugal transfer ATPase [uncultured Azohydromonas sp.]
MLGCLTDADDAAHRARLDVPFARVVSLSSMVSEHDMRTRDGDLMRVYELRGVPYETAMALTLQSRHGTLCNLIGTQGAKADCMFYIVRGQHFVSDRLDPVRDGGFATVFDNLWASVLESLPSLESRLYLVMLYRPPALPKGLFRRSRTLVQIRQHLQHALRVMEERSASMLRALRDFHPRLLGQRQHRGRAYCEVSEFAGWLVNGSWSPVRVSPGPLYRRLPRVRLAANAGVVEFHGPEGSRYAALLDIQDYGEGIVEPGWLNALLYEPLEFIEVHCFEPYGMRKSLSVLKTQRRQLIATDDASQSQIDEMDRARDEVRSGTLHYGRYWYGLAVFGNSADEALMAAARVRGTFAESNGINLALVDLLAENAWLAMCPGNHRRRTRHADISHRAFCALAACHDFYRGKRDGNPWGQTLMAARNRANRRVYLNPHASRPGEDNEGEKFPGISVFTGLTGSGKTSLQAAWLMLSRHWAPAPALVVLDKDGGLEIALRAMRATYLRLQEGVPTGVCPFQWPVSPAHTRAQVETLKAMVSTPGLPWLPSEQAALETAVNANDQLPQEKRGVSAIWQRLPVDGPHGKELSLKKRLFRWTAGQALGWVFDEAPDTLPHCSGGMTGFDYTDFLDRPEIRTPMTMALLQFAEDRLDGNRVMLVMAEAWKPLADPALGAFARDKAKTIRKQNGLCLFDTQEPGDLCNDTVEETVASQAATVVCFPDPGAKEAVYCGVLKLTPAELEIVRTLDQHGDRAFLFKQGHESAVVQFDLTGHEEAIWVLSGSTDNVKLLDAVRAEVGDDPDDWLPVLFRRIRERKARNRAMAAANREPALSTH